METYEQILSRLEDTYRQESGHSAADVSDAGLRLRIMAGELYRLQAEVDWLRRQAFPQTATGEWLDRHGRQRGILRREARQAQGTITFSRYLPMSFDGVIPAGTLCSTSGEEPLEFETLEDAVLKAGEVSVTVGARAVEGGAGGNAAAGYVNTMVEPTSLVNYLTNSAFSGGRDREDDESYRRRVLAVYAEPSSGANAGYYRDMALSWPGITAAQVIPRAAGAGTVTVYVWGEGGAPDTGTIAALQAEMNRRREVGVTVTVTAAEAAAVNVALRAKAPAGADFTRITEDIQAAAARYFQELTVGSPVYLARLSQAILQAAPLVKLEYAASMADLPATAGKIPLLGTVTAAEIS